MTDGHSSTGVLVHHHHPLRALAAALVLLLAATPFHSGQAQDYPTAKPVLSSGVTVAGETIHYPTGTAKVDAAIVTVAPGARTGWHRHGVPLFAYILAGELIVDYGEKGKRTYKAGDGFLEAMDWPHDGHNPGATPVSILVVYMGAEGAPEVLPAK
jgi:quercetin dioxygenase-like cupin family protein